MTSLKTCPICRREYGRRKHESNSTFLARTVCSRECLSRKFNQQAFNVEMRRCSRCKRTLSVIEFRLISHRSRFPKRSTYCNGCELVRSREFYAAHPKPKQSGGQCHDPLKIQARRILQSHVRRGKIKAQPCEICGAKADGHHDDYSKPLEVRWLCRKHHMMEHRKPVDPACLNTETK